MYPDDRGVEAPKESMFAKALKEIQRLHDEREARLKNDQMQAQAAMQQSHQYIPVQQLSGALGSSSGLGAAALVQQAIAPGQTYTVSSNSPTVILPTTGTITNTTAPQTQQIVADESKFMVSQAVDCLCKGLDHQYAKYDREKVKTAVEGIFEWATEGGLK